jgi:hypothetical protein
LVFKFAPKISIRHPSRDVKKAPRLRHRLEIGILE